MCKKHRGMYYLLPLSWIGIPTGKSQFLTGLGGYRDTGYHAQQSQETRRSGAIAATLITGSKGSPKHRGMYYLFLLSWIGIRPQQSQPQTGRPGAAIELLATHRAWSAHFKKPGGVSSGNTGTIQDPGTAEFIPEHDGQHYLWLLGWVCCPDIGARGWGGFIELER